MAIEEEIAALRCSIEEVSAQYVGATQQFADAVNRLAELMVEGNGTSPAPEPKTPAKKKVAKKKVAKKAEPEPAPEPKKEDAAPPLTSADVRKRVVEAIAAGGIGEMTEAMKRIVGEGKSADDLPAGDPKLAQLMDAADNFLAAQ